MMPNSNSLPAGHTCGFQDTKSQVQKRGALSQREQKRAVAHIFLTL